MCDGQIWRRLGMRTGIHVSGRAAHQPPERQQPRQVHHFAWRWALFTGIGLPWAPTSCGRESGPLRANLRPAGGRPDLRPARSGPPAVYSAIPLGTSLCFRFLQVTWSTLSALVNAQTTTTAMWTAWKTRPPEGHQLVRHERQQPAPAWPQTTAHPKGPIMNATIIFTLLIVPPCSPACPFPFRLA